MTDSERIAALEDRVAMLEEALGLTYRAIPTLTPTQNKMVGMLVKHHGIVSYERFMTALYADRDDGGPDPHILAVHIYKLRPKLAAMGAEVETIPSVGYRLTKGREVLASLH